MLMKYKCKNASLTLGCYNIFCFENYWLQREDFMQQVILGWQSDNLYIDAAKALTAKFKNLRKILKKWTKTLSNLKQNIVNVKLTLSFLNFIEDTRDLTIVEMNFRALLEE